MMNSGNIAIDNTQFIFRTNFSGNPANDRYGDSRRKANLLIPDPAQAQALIEDGFKVRQTSPRPDDDPNTFVPKFYITALLKYRDKNGVPMKYPPKVYLVEPEREPVLLNEETVNMIDDIRVKNVKVILNSYEYDPINGGRSLYIRTMYVEQDLEDDPYAAYYRNRG